MKNGGGGDVGKLCTVMGQNTSGESNEICSGRRGEK